MEFGVNAAVLLENLGYWVKQNEANETNYHDGYYWTYNSRRAFRELFPYMNKRQVDTAFQKLIDAGLVITGNYNRLTYDRTLWYTLTQKGKSILHFGVMDKPKTGKGLPQNDQPIPNINTDTKPSNKPVRDNKRTQKEFIPPTLEEVEQYCRERKNNVNAKRFYDYFDAAEWVDSNGKPVRNWKQKIITWEGNQRPGKNGGENVAKNTGDPGETKLYGTYL